MNRFFRSILAGVIACAAVLLASAAPAQNAFDPNPNIYQSNDNFVPITLPLTVSNSITSCSIVGANTIAIKLAGVTDSTTNYGTLGVTYSFWSNNTPSGTSALGDAEPLATISAISHAGSAGTTGVWWSTLTVDSTAKIFPGAFIEIRDTSGGDAVIARGTVTSAGARYSDLGSPYTAVQPFSATQFCVNWARIQGQTTPASATIVATDKVFFCVPDTTAMDGQGNLRIGSTETVQYITVPWWAQADGTLNLIRMGGTDVTAQVFRVNTSQKFFN